MNVVVVQQHVKKECRRRSTTCRSECRRRSTTCKECRRRSTPFQKNVVVVLQLVKNVVVVQQHVVVVQEHVKRMPIFVSPLLFVIHTMKQRESTFRGGKRLMHDAVGRIFCYV